MFSYYLKLGILSVRKNPVLSALMVAAIAIGIGACMTVITVYYVMSGNPIPQKSDQLFYVQLDNWDPNAEPDELGLPPDQVTYRDATALLAAAEARRQVVSYKTGRIVQPADGDARPFEVIGRASTADFFAMFDVTFRYGGGWDAAADEAREPVIVLRRDLGERLFGDENPVGERVRMNGDYYRVTGVLDDWDPVPTFYDVTSGAFDDHPEYYIPFSLAVEKELGGYGNTNCWKQVEEPGWEGFLNSECVWMQLWVELHGDEEVAAYQSFLDAYVQTQKDIGRFPRPMNNRLSDVMTHLEQQGVVDDSIRILLVLAVLFLAVCLLNTIGLLLAKAMRRSGDISLRRAVGASKSAIFNQYIVEAGMIGIAGGALGVVMTWLGLIGVKALYQSEGPVQRLAELDWVMVLTAVLLAILAAVAAALYPTWRVSRIQPASQLKAL